MRKRRKKGGKIKKKKKKVIIPIGQPLGEKRVNTKGGGAPFFFWQHKNKKKKKKKKKYPNGIKRIKIHQKQGKNKTLKKKNTGMTNPFGASPQKKKKKKKAT